MNSDDFIIHDVTTHMYTGLSEAQKLNYYKVNLRIWMSTSYSESQKLKKTSKATRFKPPRH